MSHLDSRLYRRGDVVEVEMAEDGRLRHAIVLNSNKPSAIQYHLVLVGTNRVQVFKMGDNPHLSVSMWHPDDGHCFEMTRAHKKKVVI